MFSKIKADIARLDNGRASLRGFIRGLLSQGFQAILVYRFFSWLDAKGINGHPFRFLFERFIEITTGISIPAACRIGKGLMIYHFGGIILHSSVRMGENCTLYHQVTIGDKGGAGKAAQIGSNVVIGAGAILVGEILVGDNCVIGANALVNKDVPSESVAVGNPAHFLKKCVPECEKVA